MISVTQALETLVELCPVLPCETVPLRDAAGRVLGRDVITNRDQPPFAAASMDGYAIAAARTKPGAVFRVIGESAAGNRFAGNVGNGEAVRIFTGAPVPKGADLVMMQENTRRDGDNVILSEDFDLQQNIRAAGTDFKAGSKVSAPRLLTPAHVALLAAMNIAEVPVTRRPVVALIATGDELVMPGDEPGPDQIIASNGFGLAAMLQAAGAEARLLPIARDNRAALEFALRLAEGADMIVTIGGASVGDHDIVHRVASDAGLKTAFHKVAMRPGKPLMAGVLDGVPLIGLPGNPVSAMICGQVFLLPCLTKMLGLGARAPARETAVLGSPLAANGGREHYMRARLGIENGALTVWPAPRQDSALLSVLADAHALLVRPPLDPVRETGEPVQILRL